MKIWKLEKTTHGKKNSPKQDTSDGCVVAAYHQHKARKIAAKHAGDEGSDFWMDASHSSCLMLSDVTTNRVEEGMIIHSYIRA